MLLLLFTHLVGHVFPTNSDFHMQFPLLGLAQTSTHAISGLKSPSHLPNLRLHRLRPHIMGLILILGLAFLRHAVEFFLALFLFKFHGFLLVHTFLLSGIRLTYSV